MTIFLKATAGILLAIIVYIILIKQGKDFSVLLSIVVCVMVARAAIDHLSPVIVFFEKLQSLGKLAPESLSIILKSVGIGLLAEITGHICADAGNMAISKTLQILASVVIICLSLPLFANLISLIEEILGAV